MKKICFFTNSMFKIGGEQRITSILANNLIKNNIDVTIIIKNKEDINYELYNLSPKVKLIFLNMEYNFRLNNKTIYEYLRRINRITGLFKNNKKMIRKFFVSKKMINKLISIFNESKFDIVIGVSGDRSYILSYIKDYLQGAKLIYWNHQSTLVHYKYKNTRYYNEEQFIKPLFENFDEVVCLNDYDSNLLKEIYGKECITISNCKSFISNIKSNLSNNKFMACGRLENQKGFDLLIESMKIFSNKNKDYNLDIYGEGKLEKKLKRKIKEYNLEDRITIHKNISDIKSIYLNHDIFLMSSRYEGFGLVTIEALECGLPVIAYDVDINQEIIQLDELLVKSFDYKEFALKMLQLANNQKSRKKIQRKIPSIINKYSEENFTNKWLDLINKQ